MPFFCSPKFGLPMLFFLSPSSWTFPLRQGSSSSLLILPGLLRSDRGGLSVSSPSGEREDACGLRRWCTFPALEFYSASFLHWISSLSYPYFTTPYILNKRLIKQLFPDFRRRCPCFEFPGSTGAGPRHPSVNLSQHQGLFQWVISLHQVAKVLELQLQHQSFQWIFRTDFL